MSDGGMKGAVGEVVKTTNEAVVKPLSDEVGKAIEDGVQAVTGKQLTPQQMAQKQQQDQQNLAAAQAKINYWKQIEASQAAVRNKDQQQQIQTQQVKQQESQVKQFEIREKKQQSQQAEEVKRSRGEMRAGKGVGG